jgi:acyl-CoA synthetase (AMP-forming)/AMP-acid ligase II
MRPHLLVGDIFANGARAAPRRTAVAHGDRALDFATLDAMANGVARRLSALGVRYGDRVATWASTALELAPLFAALAKIGAVYVPLSGLLGADEVGDLAGWTRPAVLVVDDAHAGEARRLPDAVVGLEELVGESGTSPEPIPRPTGQTGADPNVVFLTSGSTGRPKGVVLSHETNVLRSHPGAVLEPRGDMVCPYPLFHMGAWTIALQQWQARAAVVLVTADASAICEAVAASAATRLNCIPAVWRRILSEIDGRGRRHPLASLRFADTGTSATPPELLEAMAELLPQAHLRVIYGSTEAGVVTCLEHADMPERPGSCGLPAPGVELRLAPDAEVQVRCTTMFDGYLDDPEATTAAFTQDWFRTGDLGELDDDGFLSIVGRTGELIRTGGEAVAPTEVEAVLLELPSVVDVAVVGVPDTTWGEVVCAVVVVDGGTAPTATAVRAHCRGRLATYKHPRRVEVVEAIPRTPATGQVQRRLLVERLVGR